MHGYLGSRSSLQTCWTVSVGRYSELTATRASYTTETAMQRLDLQNMLELGAQLRKLFTAGHALLYVTVRTNRGTPGQLVSLKATAGTRAHDGIFRDHWRATFSTPLAFELSPADEALEALDLSCSGLLCSDSLLRHVYVFGPTELTIKYIQNAAAPSDDIGNPPRKKTEQGSGHLEEFAQAPVGIRNKVERKFMLLRELPQNLWGIS